MGKDAKRAEETLAKVKKERAGCAVQPDVFTRATLVKRSEVSTDTRSGSPIVIISRMLTACWPQDLRLRAAEARER